MDDKHSSIAFLVWVVNEVEGDDVDTDDETLTVDEVVTDVLDRDGADDVTADEVETLNGLLPVMDFLILDAS